MCQIQSHKISLYRPKIISYKSIIAKDIDDEKSKFYIWKVKEIPVVAVLITKI